MSLFTFGLFASAQADTGTAVDYSIVMTAEAANSLINKNAIATEARTAATADEITRCIQGNLPINSSQQTMRFVATDRANSVRELQAKSWWQRTSAEKARVNMRLLSPADLAGSSYLIAENKGNVALFTYIPALKRTQRISGKSAAQQLWGTDFSYEDMRHVQGSTFEGTYTRLADQLVNQRSTYVLEQLIPENKIYPKIKQWVDQQTCVVIQMHFYEQVDADKPTKELTADIDYLQAIKLTNGTKITSQIKTVAKQMLMRDLSEETSTALTIESIDYEPDLKSGLFNPQTFNRHNR